MRLTDVSDDLVSEDLELGLDLDSVDFGHNESVPGKYGYSSWLTKKLKQARKKSSILTYILIGVGVVVHWPLLF